MMDERIIEAAKRRCEAVMERISGGLPRSKIAESCKRTLLRLATSELKFLSRLSPSSSSTTLSCNIGYIEAIVDIIQQPCITGVSRVCKPVSLIHGVEKERQRGSHHKDIHVDIVCMLNKAPVWFIVSDRNPKYISWDGSGGEKSLKLRMQQILAAAATSPSMQPASVILFFAKGLEDSVRKMLMMEFSCSEIEMELSHFEFAFFEEPEGEWVDILARSYRKACILSSKVEQYPKSGSISIADVKQTSVAAVGQVTEKRKYQKSLGNSFISLISSIEYSSMDSQHAECSTAGELSYGDDLINFDTTALIAIVSGISNGSSGKILATPESDLEKRFKSNSKFLISQEHAEIERPIHSELHGILCGKRAIVCETVYSEFMEVVSMCGGPNERSRADILIKHLRIVPDSPSLRMRSLPTTRKLALKNKVIFGTGDYWSAPTLTANMGFVRAIAQTGMPLLFFEHRPRALVGE